MLLHPNEFASRQRLSDELGQSPPPTGNKAVNGYVSQLRKALTRNAPKKPTRVREFPDQVLRHLPA